MLYDYRKKPITIIVKKIMKIISPNKNISIPVESWRQIKYHAKMMKRLINRGKFKGIYKEAAALSHSEVYKMPFTFFVVHKKLKRFFGNQRYVINPRILNSDTPVRFEEACMSYPNKKAIEIYRHNNATIIFQYPNFWGRLKTRRVGLNGTPSFVVQHCIDHFNGIHIYDKQRRYGKISK